MGIHATNNLSHLAYDATVPYEPEMYDYDDYIISEYDTHLRIWRLILRFDYWEDARREFIDLFTKQHRKVRLSGRVFN
jgi:hypothetical protein